jgi:hypothetical protein
VTVPTDGSSQSSTAVLANGVQYTLVASGTFSAGSGVLADAEYAFDNVSLVEDFCNNDPSDTDLGIYINNAGAHTRSGSPPWGAYQGTTHQYSRSFTGQGSTVSFSYSDCNFGDNSGTLTVQIFRC